METTSTPSRVSFVVLTRDEERNIAACLGSVAGWAAEIFVIDSGSVDDTLRIAENFGARVFSHSFETHAKQWDWALRNLPIKTDWVLALDADQSVTPELRGEITEFISDPKNAAVDGCYVRRRQVFRGRWIKHGGYYPKYLLKFFRRGAAWSDERDLVDHHFRVEGRVAKLRNDIIEDNQNEASISTWIGKHNRYAVLQAHEEFERRRAAPHVGTKPRLLGTPDERILWLKGAWIRLPLYVRPLIYFLYRYIFRLGVLDGKQGFIFHFLQAYWYRLLVDINLDELRRPSYKEPEREPAATTVADVRRAVSSSSTIGRGGE
jgi:glycosyltransferase involved in cell wall biosynthesis